MDQCSQEPAAAPETVEEQSPDSDTAEYFDVIDVLTLRGLLLPQWSPFVRAKIAASLCQLRSSLEAHPDLSAHVTSPPT